MLGLVLFGLTLAVTLLYVELFVIDHFPAACVSDYKY